MQLLTRQEYNLILRSFDKYEIYMNTKERELREQLEEKLYNNFYNPKDKVTQNKIKYIKLPTRKPRKNELILSQTKGVRTNTNRGKINSKMATII